MPPPMYGRKLARGARKSQPSGQPLATHPSSRLPLPPPPPNSVQPPPHRPLLPRPGLPPDSHAQKYHEEFGLPRAGTQTRWWGRDTIQDMEQILPLEEEMEKQRQAAPYLAYFGGNRITPTSTKGPRWIPYEYGAECFTYVAVKMLAIEAGTSRCIGECNLHVACIAERVNLIDKDDRVRRPEPAAEKEELNTTIRTQLLCKWSAVESLGTNTVAPFRRFACRARCLHEGQ